MKYIYEETNINFNQIIINSIDAINALRTKKELEHYLKENENIIDNLEKDLNQVINKIKGWRLPIILEMIFKKNPRLNREKFNHLLAAYRRNKNVIKYIKPYINRKYAKKSIDKFNYLNRLIPNEQSE